MWIGRSLVAAWLSCLAPVLASAQRPDVGLTGVALAALQPVDDSYVGGPYLSEGIGGVAPGFGGALNVVAPSRLVVMAEITTARFELAQEGRLVPGSSYPLGGSGITRLHDTILAGLIGRAVGTGRTRFHFLAGAGIALDSPTVNGQSIDGDEGPDIESPSRLVLTGGVDIVRLMAARAGLVITARYSHVGRTEAARYLGIGPHIFRFGAGIRVRLN